MSSRKTSHVPTGLHMASKLVAGTVGMWKALGNLETFTLPKDVRSKTIVKPIFVSGLARSGSTILTEVISQHPQVTGHHYSDFPVTWMPYWWNSLRRNLPLPNREPRERAHRDRLMITADSPEAIEEVLWMHFFPEAHKPDCSHVMDEQESHPQFEKYYRDHIRKLLAVRNRQRYITKNNYQTTRLEYLLKLFPDARFIIPIRDPVQQVASLIKQHRLFSQQDREDSRVSRQLQLSGHYEFGPRRCPVIVSESQSLHYSQESTDLAWYANQWADLYGFLKKRMNENQKLASACLVVRYEDACSQTGRSLSRVFTHLGLNDDWVDQIADAYAPIINAPDYYQPDFSEAQVELIQRITSESAEFYKY